MSGDRMPVAGPETADDDIEIEIEDIVCSLMNQSGLLAQMRGRIARFIHENGDLKTESDVRIFNMI